MSKRGRDAGARAVTSQHDGRYLVTLRDDGTHRAAKRPARGTAAARPPFTEDPSILAAFLHPLPLDEFYAQHVGRNAVAVLHDGSDNRCEGLMASLLHGGEVDKLAEDTPSERIHVWLRPPSSADSSSSSGSNSDAAAAALESIKVDDARSALLLHDRAGASLYFRAPRQAEEALVPAFAEALAGSPCGVYYDASQAEPRGEVETFVSRAGHVTPWHFDFQHSNFTFQLSGRKTWRLKRGGVAAPVRGATPHFAENAAVVEAQVKLNRLADPSFEFAPPGHDKEVDLEPCEGFFSDAESVTLGPGDVLYFPAGMWHAVSCEEDSLSINVSLDTLSYGELGVAAVRHLLLKDAAWRRPVSLHPSVGYAGSAATAGGPGHIPPALHAQLSGMLARLQGRVVALTPADLLPPAALLSYRYGNAVADLDEEEDDDEEGSDAEDSDGAAEGSESGGEAGSTAGSSDSYCAPVSSSITAFLQQHGLAMSRRGNDVALTVVAGAKKGGAVASAPPRRLRLNPLATLFPADALRKPDEDEIDADAEWSWVAHVNSGLSGDEFASQSRVTVAVPAAAQLPPATAEALRAYLRDVASATTADGTVTTVVTAVAALNARERAALEAVKLRVDAALEVAGVLVAADEAAASKY